MTVAANLKAMHPNGADADPRSATMYAPYPPPPQPRPPRPPWHANLHVTLPISMIAVVAAICAATMVIVYAGEARTGTLGIDAAAVFEDAEAVDLAFTYRAADGTESTGHFTITADGYATGTVADTYAGTATVHTTPEGSAVRGDEDWWSRRAPSQAGMVKDQWVRPDDGTALPIDLAAEFNPTALAEFIRDIGDHGSVDPDLTAYQGVPAVAVTWEGWTLVRTSTLPAEVLSLSGPISADLFQTAAAPHSTVEAAPAVWDGGDVAAGHAQNGGGVGVLDARPVPAPPGAATAVEEQTTKTLNGQDPAADADAPSAPAEVEPLPTVEDFLASFPEFSAGINAPYCTTPTCSVSATVTNSGTGPGTAEVTTSVIPGLSPVTETLGPIAPGGSATTSTKTIPNPAPTPSPGQTTTGTAQVLVQIYSREIGGTSPDRYNSLVNKLGGPAKQPALDRLLAPLAEAAKDIAVEAMHDMLDADVPVEDTLDAMDQATQADPARGEYADTPLLRRLADAGDRFTSWASVAQQLNDIDAVDLPAYLPGLETALQELADPAAPTVSLTYVPGDAEAPMDAVVVSEYPTPEELRCTGITTVPNGDLAAGIDRATGNAAAAAEGCTVHVRLVVPESIPDLWTAGSPELETLLAPVASSVCEGGGSGFDHLTIVNGAGHYEWPLASLCAMLAPPTEQQIIERLNGLGLSEAAVEELAAANIVTVDAEHQITAVNWRDPERDCTPTYTNGGAEPATASAPGYADGPKAVFAGAYLCRPLPDGSKAGNLTLWNWPLDGDEVEVENWLAAKHNDFAIFHRCHLIAKELGGSGTDVGNLVTCFWRTNQMMKNEFEFPTRARVRAGEHIIYLSVPQYNGSDGELSGIRIVAIGNQGHFRDRCYTNEFHDPTSVPDGAC
ncbi:hypothetical protein [Glycomyces harbinensis]|uniref:DNA/RNA non-specific endonuclease n=1 Tax=Glycomyces harbinensis TaxID=58114 RepID=A0A1G7D4J4_9ACTN|nr:hypothetical protein [Glycomyces harbinensis]SDE46522.1 hypothetical protein SAMN05216270_1235 [Glycomyces harbinensis]